MITNRTFVTMFIDNPYFTRNTNWAVPALEHPRGDQRQQQ